MRPSDTIDSIKAKVQDEEGIPPAQQLLFHAGTLLNGDSTLSDYDIGEGSLLYI